MAKKADANRGRIEVEFVGDLSDVQEKLTQQVQNGGVDATPVSERPRRGKTVAADQQTTVKVDADIKAKVNKDVHKQVQDALHADWFDIQIDTGSLRKQIQQALTAPFSVTVNAEVQGQAADTRHSPLRATGVPARGGPPRELTDEMTHVVKGGREPYAFVSAINNVYRNISEAFEKAGKATFGRGLGKDPGNEVEKLVDLMDNFGDKIEDWVKFDKGPTKPATGGTIIEELKAAGITAKAPERQALEANVGGFTGDNRRAAQIFALHTRQWAGAGTPMAAQEPQVAPSIKANPAEERSTRVVAQEAASAAAKEAVIAERQASLKAVRIDPSGFPAAGNLVVPKRPTGVGPRDEFPLHPIGPVQPFPEGTPPDEAALRSLGGRERANVRRLRGRGAVGNPGGLNIDLEPFLRAAEMGQFEGVFEQVTGKKLNESQGLRRLEPQDEGGFAELNRLRGLKPGIKRQIAGQEGKSVRIGPQEALIRTVIDSLGVGEDPASVETVRGFMGTPQIAQQIRQAVDRGRSPLRGASGETKRGQGGVEVQGVSDLGKESKRLFEFIDYLDAKIESYSGALESVNNSIERASGSGRDVSGLEEQSRDISRNISRFRNARSQAVRQREALHAEPAPINAEAARLRGAQSRGRVAEGFGFTDAEKQARQLASPEAQGGIGKFLLKELGLEGGADTIRNALMQRHLAEQSRPEGRTGRSTLRQAAFGPTGRAARTPGAEAGVFGELVSQIPADIGKTNRGTLTNAIRDLLSSAIEDEGFKRDVAEQAITAKEGMTRGVRPGTTSSTIAHGLTGEGQYRFAPGQRAALEADIATQERRQGRMARLGRFSGALQPEAQRILGIERDQYTDPAELRRKLEESDSRRVLEEAEGRTAATTRQKTVGKGKYQTGADTEKLARAAGVTMAPEEPGAPPFAAFSAKYGAGAGGAAGGGGRGGGGGGWSEMLSGKGAIPVFVEGGHLDSIGGGGGSGGGGGGGGGGRAAEGPKGPMGPYHAEDTSGYKMATFPAPRRVDAVERAMEQDFIRQLQVANRGKRRKNIRYRDEGTEADRGRLFTYEPEGYNDQPEGYGQKGAYFAGGGAERVPRPRYRAERTTPTPAERDLAAALARANPTGTRRETSMRLAARRDIRGPLDATSVRDEEEERYLTRQEERTRREARRARRLNPETTIGFENEAQQAFQDIAGGARVASRSIPRRGFGASLTDLVTGGISGRLGNPLEKQLAAQGRIDAELADLRQNLRGRAEARYDFARSKEDLGTIDRDKNPQRWRVVNDRLEQAQKAIKGFDTGIVNSTSLIDDQIKIIKANRAGSFGAAAAGSVVSTAVGAATFGLGAAATVGIGLVVANGLEKILGDPSIITATRTALAEGVAGAGGRAEAGVAARVAGAGLATSTYERLRPDLERTAAIEAGNKALEQQIGFIRLGEDARKRGADAGVSQTLGGIGGTFINGTMPAAEQIGNLLGPGFEGPGVRFVPGGQPVLPESIGGFGLPGLMPGDTGLGMAQEPAVDVDRIVGDLDKFHERLAGVNEFLGKSKDNVIKFSDALEAKRFSEPEREAQARALDVVAPQLAALVRQKTTSIVDTRTGGLAGAETIFQSIADALVQATKPSLDALLRSGQDERSARIQFQNTMRDLEISRQPQQFGMALAQQGFGTGGPQTARAGIDLGGSKNQAALNKELDVTQRLYGQINREVDMGVKAAKEFVTQAFAGDPGSANVAKEFAASLDKAAQYGQQIAAIQIDVSTKQAAYQAHQFQVQIQLTKRALADAKGLVSGIGSSLGAVERQMFNLNRQAQALQLGMSQRQINFQRALAGFQIPGLTPEEQAARVEQAKLEADFAQKQLDIQKKLFGLGGKQFDIQAGRQVQDLARSLSLLQEGREVTLSTAVAEKRIKALTVLQEKENKKVQAYYEAAIARTNDIQGEVYKLAAATGRAMNEVANDVLAAFRKAYIGMRRIIDADLQPTQNTGGGGGGNQPQSALGNLMMDPTHAEGWMGSVQGATSFGKYGVAGEAGGEAVAIVRDPKKLISAPGGGGSPTIIQIIVQGNKFSTEDEQAALVRKIQDGVERGMARRGAGLGLA